jgi:FG-GAP repeat
MRRLSIMLALALAAAICPAATSAAHAGAAQATGSLEADFNNDGFADLAVGVSQEDIGSLDGAGAVNVLYGSAGGLSGTGSQAFWQGAGGVAGTAEGADGFGNALAAGDFDNDGFADLAVGVPGEGIGAAVGAGAVNVLYGSAGGLTGTGSQLFWQGAGGVAGNPEAFDLFGLTLSAGDFDNDGFADLAVAAPLEDIGNLEDAGAVNVLYGAAGGLAGAGSQLFFQGAGGVAGNAEAGDQFGRSLASGDFNNNGVADLAVGVPSEAVGGITAAGAVNVLYGSGGGLSGAGSQLFWQGTGGAAGTLEANDRFGSALAAADFNNNGFADLAAGVPGEDVGSINAAGAVNILYGAGGGLSGAGSQLFWQGAGGVAGNPEGGDLFGREVAAGDFNNNGVSDLAVSVPFEAIGAVRDAGAVNVLYASTASGLSGAGSQLFWQGASGVAGSAEEQDLFGWAISAGDFNNNGFADLAIGVLLEDIGGVIDAGAVNVLYGAGGGLSGAGDQVFWQGAPGVVGNPETDDEFGSALVGSDQPTGTATAAASRSQPKP